VNLGILAAFKYLGFFPRAASDLSQFFHGGPLPVLALVLPIGISFYTFEAISYITDVYRGVTKPARNFLEYSCFISMFPRMISGPIVRYADLEEQFAAHREGTSGARCSRRRTTCASGCSADDGDGEESADRPTGSPPRSTHSGRRRLEARASLPLFWDSRSSWAAVLGYTFQIYFDFSGYSDIAVGTGAPLRVQAPAELQQPRTRRWIRSTSGGAGT
jgi:alginate O-acetyltransferase complex protein AlgI